MKPMEPDLKQSSALRAKSSNPSKTSFIKVCTELLYQEHQIKFKAPGHSMYPTICDGDLIIIEPKKPSDVCLGDIILYRHENAVVAHRVISIQVPQPTAPNSQPLFLFRGDALIADDAPVNSEQILGKVIALERNGRRIDPYCFPIKLRYKARRLACRIKRLFFRPNSEAV